MKDAAGLSPIDSGLPNELTEKLLAGRRALIVEDEMMVMALLEEMVAELDCFYPKTAASAQDSNLNGSDGSAVADSLSMRAIRFLFASGYRDDLLNGGRRRVQLAEAINPEGR